MRNYCRIIVLFILCLFAACQQNKPTEVVETPVAGPVVDTTYELEEIDTLSVRWYDDFASLFLQLDQHRYIGFPHFKSGDSVRWQVSNGIMGAYMLTKALGKEEVLDSLIDWRIGRYLAVTQGRLRLESGNEFTQMEQFVKQFRSPHKADLDMDEEGQDRQLEIIYGAYIPYFFHKLLRNMPENKKLEASLECERYAWRKVKRAQRKLLIALYEGNAPVNDLLGLAKAQNTNKTRADLELYFALTRKKYVTSDTLYEKLTDQFAYYDVYNGFIKDIKATEKVGFGKKIKALTAEQNAWMAYIYARRVLSGKLTPEQEKIYDNATNRLQKWHIVQLKNRFKGYGYCSDAFRSSLLQDSCSYTDFYKYVPMKLDAQF